MANLIDVPELKDLCVPCEEKGHECVASGMMKVGADEEPWCADCMAGKRVCAFERNARAAAAGVSVKAVETSVSEKFMHRSDRELLNTPVGIKFLGEKEEPVKQPVKKSDAVRFCACSSDCDKPAMAGRQFAWGHKPTKNQHNAHQASKPADAPDPKRKKQAIGEHRELNVENLPFEIKTITREEYQDKFEIKRGLNEPLIKLVEFACDGKMGVIHIVKPDKKDSPRRFRDRIRRTFVRHFSKKVDFDLYVSQNVKHNHVAIEKVKR